MSTRKIILITLGAVILVGIVVGTVIHNRSQGTKVATTVLKRQDLTAIVTGSGQIKPKTYVNVGATAFGRITHLYVKEGDHVTKGQTLATIENVQPASSVAAQAATIASQKIDVNAYHAAERTAEANLVQSRADLQQKKFDIDRYQQLYAQNLVSKQDYDARKAAYDVAAATVAQREAALAQAKAQTLSAGGKVDQSVASQRANFDALDKTISRAPFDALVTNVPVREGETMVTGIQNALGSTLMTLADMSVITAEVKVDETDIVNVKLNQPVDVTVDALPGKVFKGHVTEVGDQALLRTTGIATSQSTTGTEEAKDFKVVVTLDETAPELRPGLSTTAKITTAHRPNVVTLPIQALVQRDPAIEQAFEKNRGKNPSKSADPNASATPKGGGVQGVYVIKKQKSDLFVRFVPVQTGIIGSTDIEVTSGLNPGEEVVTGRFKVLRTLHSGTRVKRDNTPETPDSSS